jgi:hypothetical protein
LNTHGTSSSAVSDVMRSMGTSADRSSVGSAHQMKPMGAPSLA